MQPSKSSFRSERELDARATGVQLPSEPESETNAESNLVACVEIWRSDEPDTVRAKLGVIAIAKGLRTHGKFLVEYSEAELLDIEPHRRHHSCSSRKSLRTGTYSFAENPYIRTKKLQANCNYSVSTRTSPNFRRS